jgi:uncharacterized protein YlzI (FlbEa/FlbD family)
MIITNAKYIDNEEAEPDTITATIDGVDSSIPMDTANRHYIEILKQVDEGTITIAEAN